MHAPSGPASEPSRRPRTAFRDPVRAGGRLTRSAESGQLVIVRNAAQHARRLPCSCAPLLAPQARLLEDLLPVDGSDEVAPVSYTHLRAHETRHDLVCRLLL